MSIHAECCRHGVYTGGCGPDYMCGYCEEGLDQWYPHTYWRCLIVIRSVYDDTVHHYVEAKRFSREEAEQDADVWQKAIGMEPYILAIYVYPQEGGYWDKSDRENERHVAVYDSWTGIEHDTRFLHDQELVWLKEQVEDINATLGEERFYVTPLTACG